jgi:hypothetical protein
MGRDKDKFNKSWLKCVTAQRKCLFNLCPKSKQYKHVVLICQYCGKVFARRLSENERILRRGFNTNYCSRGCSARARSKIGYRYRARPQYDVNIKSMITAMTPA